MKIGALSDIHADVNIKRGESGFINEFIDYLNGLELEVFIIPGDAAGSVKSLIEFFSKCTRLNIPYKIYVPGNHDIWTGGRIPHGSWVKYREVLPRVCSELGWIYLPGNPRVISNTAFLGTMGWYDYSTANHQWDHLFSEEDYMMKINPDNSKWMDIEYARFQMSDREVAGELLREAEDDLKKLGFKISDGFNEIKHSGGNINSIVFISHVVPYMEFINFRNNPVWDFFGAYIGNIHIGELLDRLPRNLRRIAFFGHTHFPGEKILPSGVEGYCVPLGYPGEYGGGSLNHLFRERIKVVEI